MPLPTTGLYSVVNPYWKNYRTEFKEIAVQEFQGPLFPDAVLVFLMFIDQR